MVQQPLDAYLDLQRIHFVRLHHPRTITAQETAEVTHTLGRELAKTVIVKLDGALCMAVLPASHRLNLDKLQRAAGAEEVLLASEPEFEARFPGCETGAMPPFGNIYGMHVFASAALADDEEISFNAGSHTDLLRMRWSDYRRLARPVLADISDSDRGGH